MANAMWQKRTDAQWNKGHAGGQTDKGGWFTGYGAGPGGMPRRGVAVRICDKPHMTGIPSFSGMDEPMTAKYTCDPAAVYNARPASIYKCLPIIPGVHSFRNANKTKSKSLYTGASGSASAAPPPLKVGDSVVLSDDYAKHEGGADGDLKPGDVGRLVYIADPDADGDDKEFGDNCSKPFKVEMDGSSSSYNEKALRLHTVSPRKKIPPEQVAKAMVEQGKELSAEERSLVAQIEAYRSVADKKKTRGRPETKKSNGKNESRDVNVWHLRNLRKALAMWQVGGQVEQVAASTRASRQLTAGILSNKGTARIKDSLHTPHRKVGQQIVKSMMANTRQMFGQVMGDVRHMFGAFDRETTTSRQTGEIDKPELKLGLSRLGIYLDILAVDELFDGIDTDKSGDIDVEEFIQFLEGCQPEEGSIDQLELDLCKQIDEVKDERAGLVIGSATNPLDGIKDVQSLNDTLSQLRQALAKRIGRVAKGKVTSDRVSRSKRMQFTQVDAFDLDMRIPRSARVGKRIPELMMRPACDPRGSARRVRTFPWNHPDPDDETKRTVLLQATAGLPRAYLAKSVRANVSVV